MSVLAVSVVFAVAGAAAAVTAVFAVAVMIVFAVAFTVFLAVAVNAVAVTIVFAVAAVTMSCRFNSPARSTTTTKSCFEPTSRSTATNCT